MPMAPQKTLRPHHDTTFLIYIIVGLLTPGLSLYVMMVPSYLTFQGIFTEDLCFSSSICCGIAFCLLMFTSTFLIFICFIILIFLLTMSNNGTFGIITNKLCYRTDSTETMRVCKCASRTSYAVSMN